MKRVKTIETVSTQPASQTSTMSARKKKRQQTFGVPRWVGKTTSGFPKELRIKHKYVEVIGLTSTAGGVATSNFSCNGLYDPNLGGVGHQPLYFDQLSAIYNHYTVIASKMTVKATMPNSAGVAGMLLGIFINDDSSVTPTPFYARAEQPTAVYRNIGQAIGETVLVKKWSAKENFGPGVLGDPNLQGTSAANPTEQQVFTIFAQANDETSTNSILTLVTIEYDAVWQELKDIANS